MKITLLLLITISIAGNCHARPGSFTESVGESVSNTWHGVKRSFKSIFGKKPQPTTTLTTTTTTEATTTLQSTTLSSSDCFEIIDGICLSEVTASPKELEDFERASEINVRVFLVDDEPCPPGFKRGSRGNCRKIVR